MATGSIAVALLAGLLSTLSPCVLPLLPLVFGAAASESRLGPFALASGLAVSFVTIGVSASAVLLSLGFRPELLHYAAAAMLLLLGLTLIVPAAEMRLAMAAGPVGNWAEKRFGGFVPSGLKGQFALGLLLGAAWSPCVGPTLGAATLMAARGQNLAQVASVMAVFGVGSAAPLLVLGMLSREASLRWRGRLLAAGRSGKLLLGSFLIAVGGLILSGLDHRLEAVLVAATPQWLVDLTTRL
jgi:cytochrome c biogenesis protein CcdA